jgi:hypothetical protein
MRLLGTQSQPGRFWRKSLVPERARTPKISARTVVTIVTQLTVSPHEEDTGSDSGIIDSWLRSNGRMSELYSEAALFKSRSEQRQFSRLFVVYLSAFRQIRYDVYCNWFSTRRQCSLHCTQKARTITYIRRNNTDPRTTKWKAKHTKQNDNKKDNNN